MRAADALALVGFESRGAGLPSKLSGEQQERVALARAIVLEPEVLLLDERPSYLDATLRRPVRGEIRTIRQRRGLTAIYVSQGQKEAMAVSDRIVMMKDAGIAQVGAPSDLDERPASEFVADFIGDANLIGCEVPSDGEGGAEVVVDGCLIALPRAGAAQGAARIVPQAHQIALRRDASPGASRSRSSPPPGSATGSRTRSRVPDGPLLVAAPLRSGDVQAPFRS